MGKHNDVELEADDIVDAAIVIFLEGVLDAVSMRSVAERLSLWVSESHDRHPSLTGWTAQTPPLRLRFGPTHGRYGAPVEGVRIGTVPKQQMYWSPSTRSGASSAAPFHISMGSNSHEQEQHAQGAG
jgi:hypothetical protein